MAVLIFWPMSVAFIHSIIHGTKSPVDSSLRGLTHGRLLHNGQMERKTPPLYASMKSGGQMEQMQLTCDVIHPHALGSRWWPIETERFPCKVFSNQINNVGMVDIHLHPILLKLPNHFIHVGLNRSGIKSALHLTTLLGFPLTFNLPASDVKGPRFSERPNPKNLVVSCDPLLGPIYKQDWVPGSVLNLGLS